jgi:NTP pyrophosphohydrolases including oxidative damage repair enzymes
MNAEKLEVNFYDSVDDQLLKFAVIVAKNNGKWVFCKHRQRNTYEVPGGHREPGEEIRATAARELYEETGAADYELTPICVYSVTGSGEESFGMLYFARIRRFDPLPQSEIEKILLLDGLPDNWTYPQIQPKLIEKAFSVLKP